MTGALGFAAALASIGWRVLDRFHFGGGFAISPHGVGIAMGYLAGAFVLMFEAKKRGIPEEQSGSLVFWALVGAIVGARGFYVIGHFSEFRNVGQVLAVYRGGISLVGGIFGAVIFVYPLFRKYKIGFLRGMDMAAIALPLGIVIGRIGDLIIGDHLGKPTSWLLAFKYYGGNLSAYACLPGVCRTVLPGAKTQTITLHSATLYNVAGRPLETGVGVHQTALYDFLSTMLLVLLVLFLSRKPRRTGILFLTFAIWYGCGRIVTDFLRVDKTFFGMTGSQWASLAVVVVSAITLIVFAFRPERRPGAAEAAPAEEEPAGLG